MNSLSYVNDPIESFTCPNNICNTVLKPPCFCAFRQHEWRLKCPECGVEFMAVWQHDKRTKVLKVLDQSMAADSALGDVV